MTETIDPTKSIIDQLVGEGKKFKTIEDLAKGKLESDTFIEQLKKEQDALRRENGTLDGKLKTAATLQEVMDKLKGTKSGTGSGADSGTNQTQTPEELKKLIESTLQEVTQQTSKKTNREKAKEALLTRFNKDEAKAKEYLQGKASELGLSVETLERLSEDSPKAYESLIGLQGSGGGGGRSVAGLNESNSDAHTGGSDRDERYYLELKNKDRRKFWSPSIQQELFKYGQVHGNEKLDKILKG